MADAIIPQHMKAAVLAEYGKPYILSTKKVPKIRATELLVKVHAAGFCHSDVQVLNGQFGSTLPMTPSHEPAGVIVQIGSECDSKWKVGDRVGVLNYRGTCSKCPGCATSRRTYGRLDPRFCDKRETAGFQHDGAFAEYMVAGQETTVLLPLGLSFEQAAPLMCAGATVWGSLEKITSGLRAGEPVGIVGIGGLGYLGIQFARSLGFRTFAIDPKPSSRRLAREGTLSGNEALRPDHVIDSSDPEAAAARIYAETDGEGLAAVAVCTDSVAANSWALRLLRIGGSLGVLGIPPESWTFDPGLLVFRELTIRGSYVAGREATERMLETVEKHGVRSDLTVVGFEDIPRVVDMYHEPSFKGRIVVRIAGEEQPGRDVKGGVLEP